MLINSMVHVKPYLNKSPQPNSQSRQRRDGKGRGGLKNDELFIINNEECQFVRKKTLTLTGFAGEGMEGILKRNLSK